MSHLSRRARGVLWGQAVGDALGTTVEFQSAEQIAARYPRGLRAIEGGGPFSVEPGQVTDDTELALCLARSLSARGRFDEEDVVRRYIAWCLGNPPDCGGTTRRAFGKAVDPSTLAAPVTRARAFTDSQANGALMRISPLAVFGWNLSPEALAELSAADTSLSHPHETCVAASQVFTFAIAYALRTGATGPVVFDATLAFARGTSSMTEAIPTLELARHGLPLDPITNMGWVRVALQCAFHQLRHAKDFEQALVDVIALGGDTDTNACITGALLGAVLGVDALPLQWVSAVRACQPPRPNELWCHDLDDLADRLTTKGPSPTR
jgi:ADP-ribosylglycohydrolase